MRRDLLDLGSEEAYVVALAKQAEQWVIAYTPQCRAEALRTLGRWAADPRLSFEWSDAALLATKIREENET